MKVENPENFGPIVACFCLSSQAASLVLFFKYDPNFSMTLRRNKLQRPANQTPTSRNANRRHAGKGNCVEVKCQVVKNGRGHVGVFIVEAYVASQNTGTVQERFFTLCADTRGVLTGPLSQAVS